MQIFSTVTMIPNQKISRHCYDTMFQFDAAFRTGTPFYIADLQSHTINSISSPTDHNILRINIYGSELLPTPASCGQHDMYR